MARHGTGRGYDYKCGIQMDRRMKGHPKSTGPMDSKSMRKSAENKGGHGTVNPKKTGHS